MKWTKGKKKECFDLFVMESIQTLKSSLKWPLEIAEDKQSLYRKWLYYLKNP